MASIRIPKMEDVDRSLLTPDQAIRRFHDGTHVPMAGVLSKPMADPATEIKRAVSMTGAAGQIRIAFLLWRYRSHPSEAPVPFTWDHAAADRARKHLRRVAADLEKLATASPRIDTTEGMAAILVAGVVARVRAKHDRSRRKIMVAAVDDCWRRVADNLRCTAALLTGAAGMFRAKPGRRENAALNEYVCDLRENVRVPGRHGKLAVLGNPRIALLCIGADVDPETRDAHGRYDLEGMIDRVRKVRRRHESLHRKLTTAVLEHVGLRS